MMQLPKANLIRKEFYVLAVSLLFINYCSPSYLATLYVLIWVLVVYALGQFLSIKKNLSHPIVSIYILTLIAFFVSLKLGGLGAEEQPANLVDYAMPLGFSYISFFSISYLVDISQERLSSKPNFFSFLSAILFFPTMMIGPFQTIQNFTNTSSNSSNDRAQFEGYCIFLFGLFKHSLAGIPLKFMLLNNLPLVYDPVKAALHPLNIMLLSAVYLYLSFSGLSDICVGLAKVLGYNPPLNFRYPFLSTSFRDYWRNWHISLGQWFKNYVLYWASNKISRTFQKISPAWLSAISTLILFLLLGLWHDISLKLVAYAVVCSILVIFFNPSEKLFWISRPITFIGILLISTLFLSKDISTFVNILMSVFRLDLNLNLNLNLITAGLSFLFLVILYYWEQSINRIASDSENKMSSVFVINFVLSGLALVLSLFVGVTRPDSVYLGF